MKTFLFVLVASFLCPFLSESVSASNGEGSVYVCNSKQAKAYHSNYDCRGLNRCKYDPDCVKPVGGETPWAARLSHLLLTFFSGLLIQNGHSDEGVPVLCGAS